jgi:hypothetical protein
MPAPTLFALIVVAVLPVDTLAKFNGQEVGLFSCTRDSCSLSGRLARTRFDASRSLQVIPPTQVRLIGCCADRSRAAEKG